MLEKGQFVMKNSVDVMLSGLGFGQIKGKVGVVLENSDRIFPEYETEKNEKAGQLILKTEYQDIFRDSLYFTYHNEEIICRRVFENVSRQTLRVRELNFTLDGITLGSILRDDYFYHNENPRIYGVMTFPIDYNRTAEDAKDSEFDIQAGNRWADPGVIGERIGASPYQPFPALLLSNYQSVRGLVHGTLSQNVFFHNYLVSHENHSVKLEIFSSFKAVDVLELAPGRVLIDEWYLGTTDEAGDIERIFFGYTEALRKKLPVSYGRSNVNRVNLVWGSWNDGIFRDVTEDMLLTEAKFLKENFPTVKWIQLDDGYSASCRDIDHGLGVPYEGEDGIDRGKFPDGLRGLTDRVRQIGLRPALWIGGTCPKKSMIFREHPEWFIDYSYRLTSKEPLDVSQDAVRGYMTDALQTLIGSYGFDAVKYDFWSYAFEDSHSLYRNKNHSGYEYRRWWLKKMQQALPADGYLQSGCDIAMGNPFLSEYFTNYRYGIDIAAGKWENVKINLLWGAACFATHTGDFIPPNSDSVGLLPGLSEEEGMFWINYCIITHSMVEIAGCLSKVEDRNKIRLLQKAVCNPNNGQEVYFVDFDYRNPSGDVPETMYFKTAHFSNLEDNTLLPLRTVGLFQIGEEEKVTYLDMDKLRLPRGSYIVTDVWSGEQYRVDGSCKFAVKAHGSRLLAVSRAEGLQVYDANIRIKNAKLQGKTLMLETDYALKGAELMVSHPVQAIYLKGRSIPFTQNGKNISFDLSAAGVLEFIFEEMSE